MRGKRTLLVAVSIAAVMVGLIPQGAIADVGNHVMYVLGRSTIIGNTCQYVWADSNPTMPGLQPDRDPLGIPRPSTLPPTCKTGTPAEVDCDLRRNLGTFPDLPTAVPPCSGNLSASDTGGCFVATIPGGTCDLNAPTWFYGYCGQTYGGATSGLLKIGTELAWTMDDFGFPRGRGIWEFNGRLKRGTENGYMRMYLAAAPDNATELAACDGVGTLKSIYFTGTIITSPMKLPRAFAPQASNPPGQHWNYCDDSTTSPDPHYNC